MKTAIILLIFLVCVIVLVVADTTDIMPPVPTKVRERAKIIPPESPLVSPDLQGVRERSKVVLPESGLSVFPLLDVQEREKNVFEEKFLESPDFQIVQPIQPVSPPYQPLQAPNFNEVAPPQIAELNDFRGGLYLDVFPTHIPKDGAVELTNALWNPAGELYTRPGYSVHSTPPEVLNFNYAFYRQSGDQFTMGGSDTALYFWHEDSTTNDGWTYLVGTGGTSGRWDGATFENWFVGTHQGIRPVKFNGGSISYLGEASYLYDSTWANNCTLWVHVKDVAWEDNELITMYAVQDSPAYQDGGRCFGKIIDNTLDAFAIDYNAQSGSNLWTPDAEVTLISALNDTIWVGGIIDTFYSEAFEGEILKPSVDTIVSQWSTKPDTLTNHWEAIWFPSFYSYIYSSDSTQKEMIGFSDHTSSLTSVEKIKVTFWAIADDQCCANLDLRVCIGDTTVSKDLIFFIEGYGTEPPYPDYFEYYFEMNRDPRGDVWTTDRLDSLVVYFRVYNKAGGATGEILVFWMQIEVTYDEFELNCAVAIFDSSLFDTLLSGNPIEIPTYFEWIPQDIDTGTAGRERREILTSDSGIVLKDGGGHHLYLLISLPEIPDLAVGDSFNLRRVYFTTAKYVEIFGDRVWLGQTGSGADLLKNNIIYSNLNSLSNFPPENHILIESGIGDEITGMKTFPTEFMDVPQYELNVFQNNAFYKILPDFTAGIYAPKLYLIADGVGCVSNSAISSAEGRVLIFPDQHGVWAYDKRKPVSISAKIDPIFEEWDTENSEDASGIFNPQDGHYYLSLPVDVDTVINANFITTFKRDSSGVKDQLVHLITTLGGEQGGDIQITDDTSSAYCDIASDTLGNYCVLLKETLNLFLFRFDSLDQRVGATIQVNDENNKVALGEVHVDMNNHGKIVVVWEDFRDDVLNGVHDIYGQCLRFSSGKAGGNFAVNSNWETNEVKAMQASVAINDDSVCVFAWQDWDDPTDFQTCIFAAIDTFPISTVANDYFKPFGGWKSPNGACELVQEGPQGACANSWWRPDVGAGDTTFVIVCSDDPMEKYIQCIVMNYGLDTLMLGVISQVEMNGSGHPSVSMNKKGRFVVAYHHVDGLSNYRIWARQYDVGGVASGSYFRVDDAYDPAFLDSLFCEYPDVAINEEDQYCIVWWDERCNPYYGVYYKCYTWEGGAVSREGILVDSCGKYAYTQPEITATNIWLEIDTTKYTLAWNIDHHGWSKETFVASAYCYQHNIFDDVKILFADPENAYVYNYGTQADDINDPVFLTYQSPYFRFSPYPWQRALISYATIESYSDSGEVILSWYSDYGTLIVEDTLIVSGYDLQTIDQNGVIEGQNISLKITTSADSFKLAGYYLEYLIDKSRR